MKTPEEQALINEKRAATRAKNQAIREEKRDAIQAIGGKKEPKRGSDRFVEIPRYTEGMDKMIMESQVGGGKNLYVSKLVQDDIRENNLVCRWGHDNGKGRMDKLAAQLWHPYTDANGDRITRPSGHTGKQVLMVRDRGVHQRSLELKREKRSAKVNAAAQSTQDSRYIPGGLDQAVTSTISH